MNSQLDNVYELLRLGYGDTYRLEDIKQRLANGKVLYASDNDYLQKLVYQYRGEIQKVVEHKKPKPTSELTRIPEPTLPTPEPTLPTPEPTLPTPEPTQSQNSYDLLSRDEKKKKFAGVWAGIFFIINAAAHFVPLTSQGWTFANIWEICKTPLGMYGPMLQSAFGNAQQSCNNASFWMPVVNFLLIIAVLFTIYWLYKKLTIKN